MSIVANEGKDVLVSYNYMLRVEGIYDLPCKAVHSFTKENEFEYLQEGGLNDYVHLLRKPISKPFTFTVERYVGTDPYPPLQLGAELVLPVILMVSPMPNRFDVSKRTFVFTGCTVMGKTYGELNAEKSGILTETVVIGYREMLEVTVPMATGTGAKKWAFEKEKTEGNGERSAQLYRAAEGTEKPTQRFWNMEKKDEAERNAALAKAKDAAPVLQPGNRVAFRSAARNSLDKAKPNARYWSLQKAVATEKLNASPNSFSKYIKQMLARIKAQWEEARYHRKETTSAVGNHLDDARASVRRWETAGDNKLGGGKASARQAPTSEAVARKWETAGDNKLGGGKASARKAPTSEAVARKWETAGDNKLGGGQESAKRNDALDKAKPEARYWSLKKAVATEKLNASPNSLSKRIKQMLAQMQARQEALLYNRRETTSAVENKMDDARAKVRKWETTGDNQLGGGKASARKAPVRQAALRKWKNGVSSAKTREEIGKEAAQRKWLIKDVTNNRSAITEEATEAGLRRWETAGDEKLGGGKASARQAPVRQAALRKWTNGVSSAKTREEIGEEAAQRKWLIKDAANNRSAITEEATEASLRRWETAGDNQLGGGKASAKQSPDSKAPARKWTGGAGSAKKHDAGGREAEPRKWLIKETESNRSAVTEKASKASARRWETAGDNQLGGGKASAKQSPDSKASVRRWEMAGGEASAKQAPETKAAGRKWPAVSSARKRQE